MPFDGLVTKSIVTELHSCVLNGKITKILEPTKNEIVLGIYANGKNYAIAICIDSNEYRIHLTTHFKPNPLNAPNFCMFLRKHIMGYRIKNIYTLGLERLITIELEGYNELNDLSTKKLIIELMGKHSNIILINENDIILDSLRHLDTSSNSNRDILPAHPYMVPLNEKQDILTLKDFYEFRDKLLSHPSADLTHMLVNRFTGFSIPSCSYILKILNISSASFSDDDLENLYQFLKQFITSILQNSSRIVPITNERGKMDYCMDFTSKDSNLSNNFFLDDFYFEKEETINFTNYRNGVLKLILNTLSKYKVRLKNINQKLEECSHKDDYQLYGELISANLYRFSKDDIYSSIVLENYYDQNSLIEIKLNKTISLYQNMQQFFKKYRKLKNASEIVAKQKNETNQELSYLESIVFELENCKNIQDLNDIYTEISQNPIFELPISKKKKTNKKEKDMPSRPREYIIDNYTFFIGRNNLQNDYLTTKLANKTDLWFHTKDIHGSHVILKINHQTLEEIPENIIITAAQLAAYYSKASLSSNVPVDYCYVKYVKKPSGSKPGMVIYSNNKTINVTPSDILSFIKSNV